MTVMEEMGRLIRTAPGPHASNVQVAHWYQRKAQLLELVAEQDAAGRVLALRQAEAAHRHADILLAECA